MHGLQLTKQQIGRERYLHRDAIRLAAGSAVGFLRVPPSPKSRAVGMLGNAAALKAKRHGGRVAVLA